MPTKRFYNLSLGKKRIIHKAITEEFTRVPFEKVSINQIIKAAGISRGSFYTYFTDKEDVLYYLFEEGCEKFQNGWVACANENNGDLWKTSEAVLMYIMENTEENIFWQVKNVVESGQLLEECGQEEDYRSCLQKTMYEAINMSGFKEQSIEAFGKLMAIISFSIVCCMGWYFGHREDKEKIKKNFHDKLQILQYGICK